MTMRCTPCGFEGERGEFGTIEAGSSDGRAGLLGRLNGRWYGRVDIYVCPRCGTLRSDMPEQERARREAQRAETLKWEVHKP